MRNKIKKAVSDARSRISTLGSTRMLLVGAALGVAVGLVAVGFRSLILFSNELFFPHHPEQFGVIGRWWRYLSVLVPAVGGLVVGLVMHFLLREDKQLSGVPEVLSAVTLKGGRLSPVMGLKGLLSAVTIGSGGSAGPEGPIVEIGSSFASYLGQKFKLSSNELRLFAGCGAAAGIAAVFGAPLGGVFFALEIILGEFAIATFGPVVLSAVGASVVSRTFLGEQPAFQVTVGRLGSLYDIIPYLVLGIFSGLASVLFVNAIGRSQQLFTRARLPGWFKPALGGLLVGLLGIATPQVLGEGYHAVTAVLAGSIIWWVALALVFAKILSTSLTLGSGAPGGAFAPALFTGAMLGGAFGRLLASAVPSLFDYNAAYALAGAAGLVAGTLNAPITAGLLIFEISGTYRVVLPCLIVVATAAAISSKLKKSSLYTQALVQAGVPMEQLRRQSYLSSVSCRQAMRRNVTAILPRTPLRDIIRVISQTDQLLVPVIDEQNNYLGAINWSQLRYFLDDEQARGLIIAHDVMTKTPTVAPGDNLSLALMYLIKEDLQEIPVVEHGRLAGLLEGKAILSGKF